MQGSLTRVVVLALAAGTALASAAVAPATASAQNYDDYRAYQDCRSQQAGNAVGGAIVGGVIGGVLGNSLAGRPRRYRRRRGSGGRLQLDQLLRLRLSPV